MAEFLSEVFENALLQRSLHAFALTKIELLKASLWRVSLDGGREHLIRGLSGLIDCVEYHVLDELIAELLKDALVEHGGRPCFDQALVKDSHAIYLKASLH